MAEDRELTLVFRVKNTAAIRAVRTLYKAVRSIGGAPLRAIRSLSRTFLNLRSVIAASAITLMFVNATKAALTFERAMAEVSTLVNTQQVEMANLENAVLGLSEAYGQEAAVSARALYNVISAGFFDVAEATHMLDASNKLAVAGVTDVNTAFLALNAIIQPYAMGVGRSSDAMDLLFTTIRQGKTTLPELSHSLSQVTPTAEKANISIEELLASISSITAVTGAQTTDVATQMRALSKSILKGTEGAERLKKAFGLDVDFNPVTIRESGLLNAIQQVTEAINTLPEAERAQALFELLGARAESYAAFQSLATVGMPKFIEDLDAMANRSGVAGEAFTKMMNSVGMSFDQTRRKFFTLRYEIGRALIDTLSTEVLPGLQDFLTKSSQFIRAHREEVSAVFAALIPGSETVKKVINIATGAIRLTIDVIQKVVNGLKIIWTWGKIAFEALKYYGIIAINWIVQQWNILIQTIRVSLYSAFVETFNTIINVLDATNVGILERMALGLVGVRDNVRDMRHAAMAELEIWKDETRAGALDLLPFTWWDRAEAKALLTMAWMEWKSLADRLVKDQPLFEGVLGQLEKPIEDIIAKWQAFKPVAIEMPTLPEMEQTQPKIAPTPEDNALLSENLNYWQRLYSILESIGVQSPKIFSAVKDGVRSWTDEMLNLAQRGFTAVQEGLNAMANISTDMFMSMIEGSKNAKEAIKDFATNVLRYLVRMALQFIITIALAAALRALLGDVSAPAQVATNVGAVVGALGGIAAGTTNKPETETTMDRGGIIRGPARVRVGNIDELFMPLDRRNLSTPSRNIIAGPGDEYNISVVINEAQDADDIRRYITSSEFTRHIKGQMIANMSRDRDVRQVLNRTVIR
jgi:TP901 family phage tail tape measure protein